MAELSGSNAVSLYRLPGVGFVRGGQQRLELASALGSSLTVRDGVGGMSGVTEYDAYGKEVYASGSDRGDFRFAGSKGYLNDDATGMQLLGARYYLPVLGRFLTQDPIGQAGGLNLYGYCGDSPLGKVDPLGLDWLDNTANFFGGWGKGLTFGLTGRISQGINNALGYGEFSYGGAYFIAGDALGTVHQMALGAPLAKLGIAAIRAAGIARETLPLFEAAQAANSQGLSAAGRALEKHPDLLGFDSGAALRQVYRKVPEPNEAANRALEYILSKGTRGIAYSPTKGMNIIEYRLSQGGAAAWEEATGKFVGFRR